MLTKTNELEKVNWNLVKHYVLQAENALNAMQAAYSEDVRQRMFQTALRFMLMAQQQVDHCMTGRARIGELFLSQQERNE